MIDGLISFLSEHRDWAFWIALIFAAAENTAFLSLAIPSTAILVGVGALIATGGLDFMPVFAGAAIGAVIGSTFSWWLGLRYGDWMLSVWPLRDYPDLIAQARKIFAKWGPLAIIIGHFFGGLRPVVFLMCGMSRMNFWWFSLFNVAGSVAWAYVVPKFGEVGGQIVGYVWGLFAGA